MTLATKAELRTDVGAWLNRANDPDFLARFDSFLALCEADFGPKIRTPVTERRLTAPLNERWEKNPAGTNQIRSVAILNGDNYQNPSLTYLSYQEAIKAYGATGSTPVAAYTIVGEQIGFFPSPKTNTSSTITFEIIAYVRPDALVDEDSDNEILVTYPGIYLWGTLLQSADYYGRTDDKGLWGQSYLAALAEATNEAATMPGDVMLVRAG